MVRLKNRVLKKGISYFLDYRVRGKRIRETLDIPYEWHPKERLAVAERYRLQKQVDVNNGKGLKLKSISLVHLFKEYLDKYKKQDIRKVKRGCEAFFNVVPHDYLVSNITKADVKEYKEWLTDKYSAETANGYFKSLKKVLVYAIDKEYLHSSPFEGVKAVPTPRNISKEVLTLEEIEKLVNTHCINQEVKRAFLTSTKTGLGNTDCRMLNYEDHIEENYIVGERGKGRKHKIPLNDLAKEMIGTGTGKVFNLPSETAMSKAIKKWVRTAGIDKHITFYSGRHTFATTLIDAKVDIDTVRRLMGHADFKYILRYLHRDEGKKVEAVSFI